MIVSITVPGFGQVAEPSLSPKRIFPRQNGRPSCEGKSREAVSFFSRFKQDALLYYQEVRSEIPLVHGMIQYAAQTAALVLSGGFII